MSLRERKKPALHGTRASGALPDAARGGKNGGRSVSGAAGKQTAERTSTSVTNISQAPSTRALTSEPGEEVEERKEVSSNKTEKKLPRVILHVRPPDSETCP